MKLDFIEKYIILAYNKGFLEIKGSNVKITATGLLELDEISTKCLSLLKGNLAKNFEEVYEMASKTHDKGFSKEQMFQAMMFNLLNSEANLLAFFMHEKDSDYKYFIEARDEDFATESAQPKGNNVFNFKKKLDH